MWGLQFQNHDRNENGDDAITERFEPVRSHAPECNTGAIEIFIQRLVWINRGADELTEE